MAALVLEGGLILIDEETMLVFLRLGRCLKEILCWYFLMGRYCSDANDYDESV